MIHDLDQFQTDCSNGQAITTMAGSSNIKMQDSLPFEIGPKKAPEKPEAETRL